MAPEIKDGQLGEDNRLLFPYTSADICATGKILDNLVRDSQTNSTYPTEVNEATDIKIKVQQKSSLNK